MRLIHGEFWQDRFPGRHGLSYGRIPFALYNGDLSNPGFTQGVTLLNGTVTEPSLGSPGAQSAFGINTVGAPNSTFNPQRTQTYSFTIEREIVPGGVFNIAYVGSHTNNYSLGYDHNFPLPVAAPAIAGCALSLGESYTQPGGFRFDPCLNIGAPTPLPTRAPFRCITESPAKASRPPNGPPWPPTILFRPATAT